MPREYIQGNNGVDITSERQDRIDEILKDLDLSVDQRGNSPLLSGEFLPNDPDLPECIYLRVYLTENQKFILISSVEIPQNSYGRIRLTQRDGSSEITPPGYITETRKSYRKEDANNPRFVSVFNT